MRFVKSSGLLVWVVSSVLASAAHAQWTVSYLQPAGATNSNGRGASGVDQAGYATVGGTSHAARWTGSAASFVDLNPAVAGFSQIEGTDGVNQVGSYRLTPTIPPGFVITRAAIWSGTAASFVDLHPIGFTPTDFQESVAVATEGGLQTGRFRSSESAPTHAAKWNGTAASYVDIHPTGYVPTFTLGDYSQGLGTDGINIVGLVQDGGTVAPQLSPSHAGLWKFAPDVFIDLQPAGVIKSIAYDVEGNIQVGEVGFSNVAGSPTHAALWSGTAASFVDLNPAGASTSSLFGTDGGFQVGSANIGGVNGAGIWSGTAGSFLSLHSFLTPGTYSSSEARSVWTNGATTYVVGTAFNNNLSRNEAVLWTLVPEPATLSMLPAIGLLATCSRRRRG